MAMRYLPKSPSDREEMLNDIGVKSVDALFAAIPEEYRLTGDLRIPRSYAESEIVEFFRDRAAENGQGFATFLGAGAYSHYRPVVIDALVSRGEFFTAYTPYQPEIAQGTLQSIFEFQTMISELTGMDVANASMYDGSTGSAEALMMAVRVTGRHKSVIATSVHPEYREVIATYARHQGMPLATVGYGRDGRIDLEALDKQVDSETAGVLVQSPNFFGIIEDIPAIRDIVHKKGALLVVSIEFVKLLLPFWAWRALSHFVMGWILFPLRYLDLFLFHSPLSERIGNHCYIWLRKPEILTLSR